MGGSGGGFFKESKPAKLFRDPKKFIKKQFNPSDPQVPGVPEFPEIDAEREELLKAALISRLRADMLRGGGRSDLVATSAQGIIAGREAKRRKLAGA